MLCGLLNSAVSAAVLRLAIDVHQHPLTQLLTGYAGFSQKYPASIRILTESRSMHFRQLQATVILRPHRPGNRPAPVWLDLAIEPGIVPFENLR